MNTNIENLELILKNSKINLMLSSNNLRFIDNLKDFTYNEKIIIMLQTLSKIEEEIGEINWIIHILALLLIPIM